MIIFYLKNCSILQEAEIKLMAAQVQFAEMPITCQPHKMSLWDKMVASFSCKQYEMYPYISKILIYYF